MNLRKKIQEDVVASASYLPKGIALRVRKGGDQHDNSIATIEHVDGKPCRVTFKQPLKGDGFQVRGMNVTIVEHKC